MKSIFIGLTLTLWILWYPGYTQTDSVYCLSITKARLLIADALRLRLADSLQTLAEQRVTMLERERVTLHNSFINLLKIEQEKFQVQKEITSHQEAVSSSYKEENQHLKKKVRGLKWQRAGLGVITIVVIGLSL